MSLQLPVSTVSMQLTTLLTTIEIAATIAFAMSGLIEATRKKMDIVGVFSVTFVSAFAGGTARDVLLDRRPFFWVENTEYIWLVIAMVLAAPLMLRSRKLGLTDKVMEVADALGLGLFTISGVSVALVAGMPLVVALMLGSITAVFGGVTRDVLCNEIPKVYRDHQPYTLCTLIGGLLFIGLNHFGVSPHLSSLAGICCISGLRLLAVAYGWQIPSWPRDA
ncbi:trimeric intracellular cation channel family protein [Zoogloea sp.]|uniref:trimeric intracellular cation channel family protein n=1 Tax=Zoogloea sp. TaxID=49181 RepID=UPI0035AF7DED